MKFTPRFGFSLILVGIAALLGSAGLTFAAADEVAGAAAAQAPVAAPAAPLSAAIPDAPAPRLTAVRASVAEEAVTLTLEVTGEFTHVSSAPGGRLIFVDLLGAIPAVSSESRILESDLVSSYRVVSFSREGRPNARLELLLRKPITISTERKPGALQVKLEPAVVATAVKPAAPAPPQAQAAPAPAPARTEAAVSAPVVSRRARGNAVEKVTVAHEEGVARVQIRTNGPVEYRAFQLANPARLVVDIPATESQVGNREIPVGVPPLKSIRVAQFSHVPLVSRVVIDLDSMAPYQVRPQGNMLEVELKLPAGQTGKPAPVQARPARPLVSEAMPVKSTEASSEKAPEIAVPASLENLVSLPALHAMVRPDLSLLAPLPQNSVPAAEPAKSEPPATSASELPPPEQQQAPATASEPPKAEPAEIGPPPLAPMNVTAATVPAVQPPPLPAAPAQQPAAPPAAQAAPMAARYSGEPISVNLKDVDLKDFFRLIHEISGLNIVLDPVVSGRVTIVLEDVPWDQALDIVLRNNALDKQLEGNVLRIARRDTLRREEEERLALETAKQAAADRVTAMRSLNYARATEMMTTLSKFRSPKGEIIADERTNTLIITDIPQVIPVIDDIIKQLDRRTVQVEIEARVVAASRNFSRDVGAQFGFATTAAGRRTLFTGNQVGNNQSPARITGAPEPIEFSGGSLPLFSNFPAAGASSGFGIFHRSPNASIDLLISLAETKGIGKLLSRPRIITQNNVQGEIQQGVRIPVQTTINNTISVQFISATLRLTVRPQVTNEGSIFLDVSVENSSIDPGVARINGVPALDTQLATTKVLVSDGGTVVFGGVLQNQNNLTVLQVPLLGSVPVIGHLFKRTGITTQTNELLFFITPKIV